MTDWKFLANFGDRSFVEHGGVFLYESTTEPGSFYLEKLEEPCDDDHCEECEEEPDLDASDAIWDIDRACDRIYDAIEVPDPHPDFTSARAAIYAAAEPQREAARQAAKAEHEAWEKHIAEHERWTVYRVHLERFDVVREFAGEACRCPEGDEHLSPESGETLPGHQSWWDAHYQTCPYRPLRIKIGHAWFYNDLTGIASTMGTTKRALIRSFCSKDGRALAWAWNCVLDYWGWVNGDSYPLKLSLPEVEKRYEDVHG